MNGNPCPANGLGGSVPKTTWLWWSSGKDSAWALHALRTEPRFKNVDVTALVTTVNAVTDRVAMHAVRTALVRAQARSLKLPLHLVEIPYPCPNGAYEAAAQELIIKAERWGVTHMAFGDLFLEDIRSYREDLLASSGIAPIFPLWGRSTAQLAQTMLHSGLVANLTCVDPKRLAREWVGRPFDHHLLRDLPDGVDPCGENGEFHTVVSWAPGFDSAVELSRGQVVERDGFVFADFLSPEP